MSSITFRAKLWLYTGAEAAWHFVTLPTDAASQVRFQDASPARRGFGSVRVQVKIGNSVWKTSVFPDKKSGSYILPIKSDVRKRESIAEGDTLSVTLDVL